MTKRTIITNIVADVPTRNSNIYPKSILEKAIKQFNNRTSKNPIKGGILDPSNIDGVGEPTHITRKLFLNDSGVMCAEIELLDTEAGQKLVENLNKDLCIARPIMCVPAYVDILKAKEGEHEIAKINSIVRVQVEYNDKKSK